MSKINNAELRGVSTLICDSVEKIIRDNANNLFIGESGEDKDPKELKDPKDPKAPMAVDSEKEAIKKSLSRGKKKLVLVNPHSPGDIVMMTSAIRDLHATYPNEYLTDIDTPCAEIFEGNPYITKLNVKDEDTVKIRTHYPLIHNSNEGSYHFVHGYRKHLEECIGRPIKQGDFKGDIHIRDEEKGWVSAIEEVTKDKRPFWIIDAGYKGDFTAKAWSFKRYQEVVDHFRDKIQFVQIGHSDHYHPNLKNVINMVGETDLRQLIRLVYHSIGVLTPVSLPMVLSVSVPNSFSYPKSRACVVIAGGREPVQWQAFPNHQFLHMCGAMECCDLGGCWKSRVVPLGDGDEKDKNNLCLKPVKVDGQDIPMCMAAITSADVIRSIEKYYVGVFKYNNKKTIGMQYRSRDKAGINTYDKEMNRKDAKDVEDAKDVKDAKDTKNNKEEKKEEGKKGDEKNTVAEAVQRVTKNDKTDSADPDSFCPTCVDRNTLRKIQDSR